MISFCKIILKRTTHENPLVLEMQNGIANA